MDINVECSMFGINHTQEFCTRMNTSIRIKSQYRIIFLTSAYVLSFIIAYIYRSCDRDSRKNIALLIRNERPLNSKWLILPFNDQVTCGDLNDIISKSKTWNVLIAIDNEEMPCQITNVYTVPTSRYSFLSLYADSTSRKRMAGYLFAIQNGAKYIFDMDTDLRLDHSSLSHFIFKNWSKYLVPKTKGILNPFAHFGQPDIFTNGFESASSSKKINRRYELKPRPLPVIQHSVYEGFADNYRSIPEKNIPILFDQTSPPFVLPDSTLAPMPAKNTVTFHQAFWTLFLPASMTNRESVINRSLWAQKLLSIGKFSVAFLSPNKAWNSGQEISSDNSRPTQGMMGELLKSWSCSGNLTSCVARLADDLSENGLWTELDRECFKAWIETLGSFQYLIMENFPFEDPSKITNDRLKMLDDKIVSYFPISQSNLLESQNSPEYKRTTKIFNESCPQSDFKSFSRSLTEKTSKFLDVALIVHFNFQSRNKVMSLIRLLYKPQFPVMLICGHVDDRQKVEDLGLTFIPSYEVYGYQNSIDCDVIAMQMGYQVSGYLQTHDDNILHPWHMTKWNRDQIWHTPPYIWMCASGDARTGMVLRENGSRYDNVKIPYWVKPKTELEKIVPAFDEMMSSADDSVLSKCNVRLVNRLKGKYRFDFAQADHFFVPRRLSTDFAEVLTHFIKHNLFFEIAIPTALKCIEDPSKHLVIKFRHLHSKMKTDNLKTYHTHVNYSYVHPYKLGQIFTDEKLRNELFCNQILKEIYNRW